MVNSRSKYHSIKTAIGGRVFDSKAEANRFAELRLLMRAGEVKNIECQPKFLLQDSFKKNGKTYRKIEYIADFKITYADGRIEIEDVKSKGTKTEAYKIKKKLFELKYPDLTIVEVFM
jgi:hypothetical protein